MRGDGPGERGALTRGSGVRAARGPPRVHAGEGRQACSGSPVQSECRTCRVRIRWEGMKQGPVIAGAEAVRAENGCRRSACACLSKGRRHGNTEAATVKGSREPIAVSLTGWRGVRVWCRGGGGGGVRAGHVVVPLVPPRLRAQGATRRASTAVGCAAVTPPHFTARRHAPAYAACGPAAPTPALPAHAPLQAARGRATEGAGDGARAPVAPPAAWSGGGQREEGGERWPGEPRKNAGARARGRGEGGLGVAKEER